MTTIKLQTFFPTIHGRNAAINVIAHMGIKHGINNAERSEYMSQILINMYNGMDLYRAVTAAICEITINGIEQ